MTIGVLQASILGRLSFILHANDVLRVLPSFVTNMYGDDTTLLSRDADFNSLVNVGSMELKLFMTGQFLNALQIC